VNQYKELLPPCTLNLTPYALLAWSTELDKKSGEKCLTHHDVHIKMYTKREMFIMDISAAEFRKNLFQILGQVEQTHQEVIITRRGKPVAKLVSIDRGEKKDPLLGALAGLGRTVDDLTEPVVDDDAWELD
jgi:prevent-host-death family protein